MSSPRPNRRRSRTKMPALVLAATSFAATFSTCGRDQPGLSNQAAADLQARVGRVRAAAVAGNGSGAGAELAALRSTVDRYRGQGQISAERAADVLAAAGEVEAGLALLPPPAPAATTTTTSTPVRRAPVEPEGDKEDEEDKDSKGGGKKKKED